MANPLPKYKLTDEEIKEGLALFETLGVIRAEGKKYVLTETGEHFLAAVGCGRAGFGEVCFQLLDSLVKSGKLKCRYNLKDKSYYFNEK
ncbi:MAG: hypothetical protein QXF56_00980 [Candidatus Micrarchaeia archaeon]